MRLQAHSCGSMLPSYRNNHHQIRAPSAAMLDATRSCWRYRIPVVLPRSCMRHLAPNLPTLQRSLFLTATPTKAMQRPIGCTRGKHTWCCSPVIEDHLLPEHISTAPALFAGLSEDQASPLDRLHSKYGQPMQPACHQATHCWHSYANHGLILQIVRSIKRFPLRTAWVSKQVQLAMASIWVKVSSCMLHGGKIRYIPNS